MSELSTPGRPSSTRSRSGVDKLIDAGSLKPRPHTADREALSTDWPRGSCLVVSVEGIDGSGKTTLVRSLIERLREERSDLDVLSTVEFSSPLGAALRSSLADLPALSRAYAFAAERHWMVARILQAVPDLVIWDRYIDSSFASRIADSMLGFNDAALLLDVAHDIVKRLPKPHMTLLVDIDPAVAHSRVAAREGAGHGVSLPYDIPGLRALAEGFAMCIEADPGRFIRLDGRHRPGQLCDEAILAVKRRLREASR